MSAFDSFAGHLYNLTKNNKNITFEILPHGREIKISIGNKAYQHFGPTTYNRTKRSVEIGYGEVANEFKGQGLGTRLREYGVHAAKAAGVPLFHEGINMRGLVGPGKMPISTHIVRHKLGAEPAHGLHISRTGRIVKPKVSWPSIFRFHRYQTRQKTRDVSTTKR